jgi:hypothetical protein
MVEPASDAKYRDQNKLANVVLPGEPQYAAVMRGESVPPEPVNAKPRKAQDTPAGQSPAWASGPTPPAPASGGVPWANQGQAPNSSQPAPAAGPDWLNQ